MGEASGAESQKRLGLACVDLQNRIEMENSEDFTCRKQRKQQKILQNKFLAAEMGKKAENCWTAGIFVGSLAILHCFLPFHGSQRQTLCLKRLLGLF